MRVAWARAAQRALHDDGFSKNCHVRLRKLLPLGNQPSGASDLGLRDGGAAAAKSMVLKT